MQKIGVVELKEWQSKNCAVIDTRPSELFAEGFIKGSISIPFNENFVVTLDELTNDEQKIVFIADSNNIESIATAVRNSGVNNVVGYLDGGYEQWKDSGGKIDLLITIEADEFAMDYQFDEFYLVDVRSKEDFEKGHVEDSENISLHDLEQIIVELDAQESYYVYGSTAADPITAGSLFKRYGVERIRAVITPYHDIRSSGIPVFTAKKGKTTPNFPNRGITEN